MDVPKFDALVLKWAREKRFGPKIEALRENWAESWEDMTPEMIVKWENGAAEPTFGQVKALARIYKRPLAVFFLDGPPPEKGAPPDLRTIGSRDNKFLSPDALLAIRKARRIQEASAVLSEELHETIAFKYPRFSLSEDPSTLANKVRLDLAIRFREQAAFKTYEDFFEDLRNKFEHTGIITLKSGLHDSFPTEDCRAFSFTDQQPYVILVNNKDAEGAKNFSLAHEFAHILLRESGICNNFNVYNGRHNAINRVEVFCNQFAANFLVPSDELLQHPAMRGKINIVRDELDDLAERLALAFKVSRVVILRRFLALGRISPGTYEAKVKAWDSESHPRRKGRGRFSLKTTLAKSGRAFSSLVLDSYRQKKISYSAVSDYLGVKTKHLPKLEKLIDSHAR